MGFSIFVFFAVQLCMFLPVTCDYDCVCNYQASLPVYTNATAQSQKLGSLDEFMCKAEVKTDDQDWFALQYNRQIGYVESTSGMVLQQTCPGDPPKSDIGTTNAATDKLTTQEAKTSSPTKLTTPTQHIQTLPQKTSTVTTSTTSLTTTISTTETSIYGDTSLCHESLHRWSKSHPTCTLSQFRDRCYLVDPNIYTIFDVMPGKCGLSGGKMLSIRNQEEQKFITRFLKNTLDKPVWVAYNSPRILYRWPAHPLSFTNWSPNPGVYSGTTNCAVLMPGVSNGQWFYVGCWTKHHGICQYPTITPSLPRATAAPTQSLSASQSTPGIVTSRVTQLHLKTTQTLQSHINNPSHTSTTVHEGEISRCGKDLLNWKNKDTHAHLLYQWNKSCYTLDINLKLGLAAAKLLCNTYGAKVADIQSKQEQEAVQRFLQTHGYNEKVLIGFTDYNGRNTFYWSSGVPMMYINWAPNEPRFPSHISQDCTVLDPRNGGKWESRLCIEPHTFICEYAMES